MIVVCYHSDNRSIIMQTHIIITLQLETMLHMYDYFMEGNFQMGIEGFPLPFFSWNCEGAYERTSFFAAEVYDSMQLS